MDTDELLIAVDKVYMELVDKKMETELLREKRDDLLRSLMIEHKIPAYALAKMTPWSVQFLLNVRRGKVR